MVRDVLPGEIVRIDAKGVSSTMVFTPTELPRPAFCVFEFVYFARPDSVINDLLVHAVSRENLTVGKSEVPPYERGLTFLGQATTWKATRDRTSVS